MLSKVSISAVEFIGHHSPRARMSCGHMEEDPSILIALKTLVPCAEFSIAGEPKKLSEDGVQSEMPPFCGIAEV